MPGFGDFISFCIFIASMTTRPCPWPTTSPSATSTRMTFPGMGALTFVFLPTPRPRRPSADSRGSSISTSASDARTSKLLTVDENRVDSGFHLDYRRLAHRLSGIDAPLRAVLFDAHAQLSSVHSDVAVKFDMDENIVP